MMLCVLYLYVTIGFLFGIFLFFWDEDCVAVKHLIVSIVASVFLWPFLLIYVILETFGSLFEWIWVQFESNGVLNKRLRTKKDD